MLGNSDIKSITIAYVDKIKPSVILNYDDSTWAEEITVIVNATDKESGLAVNAYRYFNGSSWSDWTSLNTYTIKTNGSYKLEVRDILNNTESISFDITHIDEIAPTFNYSVKYNDMQNNKVKVVITDIIENESGLHKKPYSFDNGITWVSSNEIYLYGEGSYIICVRDKCENVTSKEISLNCLIKAEVCLIEIEKPTLVQKISASFKMVITNYSSYEFVRQFKDSESPSDAEWELVEIDNETYAEDILCTTTSEKDGKKFVSRTLTFTSYDENCEDYWYGIVVKQQDDNGKDLQVPLYAYGDVIVKELCITPLLSNIEAGDTLYINDFNIITTFNNNNQIIVSNKDKYEDTLTFENGEKSVVPKTVGDYKDNIYLSYRNNNCNAPISIKVIDTTAPIIEKIFIENYEITDTIQDKEFVFNITAYDNSNGPLQYGIGKIQNSVTPKYHSTNTFSQIFNENTYIYVYVKDSSGNIAKKQFYTCYIDLKQPEILDCIVTPSINEMSQKYDVLVTASDDCTNEHELLYQFIMNDKIVQDYSSKNTYTVKKNGTLQIFVKDKAGKVTKYPENLIFDKLDVEAPHISDVSIKSSTNYVIATIFAEDNLSDDLIYGYESFAGNVSQKNNFFTIEQSGDYTFFAIDETGNKSEKTVYINLEEITENSMLYNIVKNINVKTLGNSYEYNGEKFTNTGYNVTISFIKEVDDSKTLTSLNNNDYSNQTSYFFSENGTYVINSRYTAEESEYTGPVVYQNTLNIKGIDKTKPTISINKSNGIAYVNVKDDMSGISKIVIVTKNDDDTTSEKEVPFSSLHLAAAHNFSLDENKVYQIYCIDNVGNKSKTSVISSTDIIETEENVKTYKVVFISEQGGILKIQEVIEKYPAIAPIAPEKNGYTFKKWSEDYSCVTKNMTIYPLYDKLSYNGNVIPYYDESLRYKLTDNQFAFSSKYAGFSEIPLDKVAAINPYEEGLYEFKKLTYNNDAIQSSNSIKNEEKKLLNNITLNNPIIFAPLLILLLFIIIVHFIRKRTTK